MLNQVLRRIDFIKECKIPNEDDIDHLPNKDEIYVDLPKIHDGDEIYVDDLDI